MMIDTQTSARLELLYSLSNEPTAVKKFSLYAILNFAETRIGQRHLRANILEPSCSIDVITHRQEQIKILLDENDLLQQLKEKLQNFRSVDQLLKISYVVPADDSEKAIETNIQMALQLKFCLEAVKPLAELVKATVSESFEESRQLLTVSIFDDIIKKIDEVIQPDIHKNRMAQKHFQHLFAVRGKVNETVDFLRKLYTESADRIRDYVAEVAEKTRFPIKLIHSTKLGYHLHMKNPNNVQLSEEFHLILRKGANFYLTTSHLLALNDTTQTISTDIIRMSNTILCDMLIEIASEIDVIHHLIGIIIDLDVVQSLTEASNQENYCCPKFNRIMKIEAAFHPMLEYARNKETAIANNVVS